MKLSRDELGILVIFLLIAIPSLIAYLLIPQTSNNSPAPGLRAVVFSEDKFYWDDNTSPHRDVIIRWVTEIANDVPGCRNLDPASAYLSEMREPSPSSDPAFYVTCENAGETWNVWFDRTGIIRNGRN